MSDTRAHILCLAAVLHDARVDCADDCRPAWHAGQAERLLDRGVRKHDEHDPYPIDATTRNLKIAIAREDMAKREGNDAWLDAETTWTVRLWVGDGPDSLWITGEGPTIESALFDLREGIEDAY